MWRRNKSEPEKRPLEGDLMKITMMATATYAEPTGLAIYVTLGDGLVVYLIPQNHIPGHVSWTRQ